MCIQITRESCSNKYSDSVGLHFSEAPRCCCCCWSRKHILRTTGLGVALRDQRCPGGSHFWMGQGASSLLACLSGFLVAVLFPVTSLPLFFLDFSFTLSVDGFYSYQEVICPLSLAFHCVISENAVSLSLQSCVTKRNITSIPHLTTDNLYHNKAVLLKQVTLH